MQKFYTVLTNVGLAKLAAAHVEGSAVKLQNMHVGTGGGSNYYDIYDADRLRGLTALVDEKWSSQLNDKVTDPDNPSWVVLEAVIPSDVGGWTIREIGISDEDGDMIAIGRFPETVKPNLGLGSTREMVLQSIIEVSNAESVTLAIDPSFILATRKWVNEVAIPEAMELLDERVLEAAGHADRSEVARDIAQLAVGIFKTTALGIAATNNEQYFWVPSENDIDSVILYENVADSAVPIASYPTAEVVRKLINQFGEFATGFNKKVGNAPYTSFDDDVVFAEVDKHGRRMDLPYIFENFSDVKPRLAPYLSFYDDVHFIQVDRAGKPLDGIDELNVAKQERLSPYLSYEDSVHLEHFDRNGKPLLQEAEKRTHKKEGPWGGPIYIEYKKEEQEISVAWVHEPGVLFKQTWLPNGANFVFNYRSLHHAPFTNDPASAEWTLIGSATTDHIPPITHKATTGETTDSGISTVGGNHTGPNGELTAFMTYCDFFLDDTTPLTEDFSGFADSVLVRWSNDMYAGNTIFQERVTTRQEMSARFTPRHVEVYSKVTALEPINVVREGGTQMTTAGFRDVFHFYGGKQQGSIPYSTDHANSGTRAEAPDTWACVCKSNTHGYFAAWLDREYGVGSQMVEENDYLSHKNASKLYNFTVRHESGGRDFAAGESYSWRGGYAYAPLSMTDGLDGAFIFRQGDKLRMAVANNADQLDGTLRMPHELIGAEFDEIGSISGIGTLIEFSEYSAKPHKEIV